MKEKSDRKFICSFKKCNVHSIEKPYALIEHLRKRQDKTLEQFIKWDLNKKYCDAHWWTMYAYLRSVGEESQRKWLIVNESSFVMDSQGRLYTHKGQFVRYSDDYRITKPPSYNTTIQDEQDIEVEDNGDEIEYEGGQYDELLDDVMEENIPDCEY
jgi:hypothetical protein